MRTNFMHGHARALRAGAASAYKYLRAYVHTRTGTGAYTKIYAGYVKVFKVFKCMRAYICRFECQCVDAMKQSRKLCD